MTQPPGYRLQIEAGQLDASRFDQLVTAARRELDDGNAEAAAAGLRTALGLWRGPALSDVADFAFAQADVARLEEARLARWRTGSKLTWPAAGTPASPASSTGWPPPIRCGSGCAASG